MNAMIATRITRLHAIYDGILHDSGVAAMRTKVQSDLRDFHGYENWLDAITDWIYRAGWQHTADLLVDAAEYGGDDVRRSCAAMLLSKPTPLVTGTSHGPRLIKLHLAETDNLAKGYWLALRERLGI